jgi:hypothetical protein
LKIVLRATSRLQSSPAAAEAFRRAAARWEAWVDTDITVVVDVDFGPDLFGESFTGDVVSVADSQVIAGNVLYPAVRQSLISQSFTSERAALTNSLPAKRLLTDLGAAAAMSAPSATLRALGLLDQNSDPSGELEDLGPPPAIALNSRFAFDFNADDGIDPDKLDAEAMIAHDLGHVLGFVSSVGQQELDPSLELEPSIWDLFRGRPDSIRSSFGTAQRTMSSGGEQSFYAGGNTLNLSTGRGDGSGGDRRQPSHWKDDDLAGIALGVMDPTIAAGQRQFVSENDLIGLRAIGYRARSLIDPLSIVPLASGLPASGGIIAPPAGVGAVGRTQYSIVVLPGASELRVDLVGNQDVDLYLRFGQPIIIQSFHLIADFVSASETGTESIIVSPASSKPLRAGIYYIAIVNFGPGDASFSVTATGSGGANGRSPGIFDVRSRLEGDLLTLDYAATDADADWSRAEIRLSDDSGGPVGDPKSFEIDSADNRIESSLIVSGLGGAPSATRANIVLIDRAGNRSSSDVEIDFSRGESGGMELTGASYDGTKLTLSARGTATELAVEINGVVVAPPRGIKSKKSGRKLIVKGTGSQLNLRSGINRIRVRNGTGWSNSVGLSM